MTTIEQIAAEKCPDEVLPWEQSFRSAFIAGHAHRDAEVAALRSALEEADEYLSQTVYEKGKPVMLNSIGAGSKIHNNIKNALKPQQ